MQKKPIFYLIFKIIGLIGIVIFVVGLIKLVTGFGDFESNDYLIGMFMMPFGAFIGFAGLVAGFKPEISKLSINSAKYIQQQNKEELQHLVKTSAEISAEAVTTTAQAISEGLRKTVYCKHCGNEVDADSQFCKYCGKKL